MLESIEFKVYFSCALYPQGTFDNFDDDEYDFAEDREEKFNEYLVVGDKVPYVIKRITESGYWNTENEVYMTKISYKETGTFVAQICFKNFSEDILFDDFMLQEIVKMHLWPVEEDGTTIEDAIIINNEYFQFDIEIEDIQEINNVEESDVEESDVEESDVENSFLETDSNSEEDFEEYD